MLIVSIQSELIELYGGESVGYKLGGGAAAARAQEIIISMKNFLANKTNIPQGEQNRGRERETVRHFCTVALESFSLPPFLLLT